MVIRMTSTASPGRLETPPSPALPPSPRHPRTVRRTSARETASGRRMPGDLQRLQELPGLVRVGVLRIELEELLEVGLGLGRLARGKEGETAIVVGIRQVGVLAHDLVELGQGLGHLALVVVLD